MHHSARALNMNNTLGVFFIERSRDAVCSTNKNVRTNTRCEIAVLSTKKMAACAHAGARVYKPVRPLVLIYNSMLQV